MVRPAAADVGEVDVHVDARGAQRLGRTDPRAQQDPRRADRARAQHDLPRRDALAGGELDPDRAAALEDDPLHGRVGAHDGPARLGDPLRAEPRPPAALGHATHRCAAAHRRATPGATTHPAASIRRATPGATTNRAAATHRATPDATSRPAASVRFATVGATLTRHATPGATLARRATIRRAATTRRRSPRRGDRRCRTASAVDADPFRGRARIPDSMCRGGRLAVLERTTRRVGMPNSPCRNVRLTGGGGRAQPQVLGAQRERPRQVGAGGVDAQAVAAVARHEARARVRRPRSCPARPGTPTPRRRPGTVPRWDAAAPRTGPAPAPGPPWRRAPPVRRRRRSSAASGSSTPEGPNPPASAGRDVRPHRAVDRARTADPAPARHHRGQPGAQLDRVRPVARVAGCGGGERADVARRPAPPCPPPPAAPTGPCARPAVRRARTPPIPHPPRRRRTRRGGCTR